MSTQRPATKATKTSVQSSFGERLARIRKSRAMTQSELGEKVGLSQRMIAYYERESAQPPGALLSALAEALRVSSDELIGLRAVKDKTDPKSVRLLNRLKKIEELPPADQRTMLKILDSLLARRGKGNGR